MKKQDHLITLKEKEYSPSIEENTLFLLLSVLQLIEITVFCEMSE